MRAFLATLMYTVRRVRARSVIAMTRQNLFSGIRSPRCRQEQAGREQQAAVQQTEQSIRPRWQKRPTKKLLAELDPARSDQMKVAMILGRSWRVAIPEHLRRSVRCASCGV